MAIVSFWSTVIMAITLCIVSHFGPVSTQEIPWIKLTLSRWWDVLFLPAYSWILFLMWMLDTAEKKVFSGAKTITISILDAFAYGVVIGLLVGFSCGLFEGLGAGFVAGLGVGVIFGICFAFIILFVLLVKVVVNIHKWLLKN
ncbi:MAG: hypothetical protein PHE59_00765 [Patescibacteria group bacterium]|nr:hypothetical protein [Patescibacteria group bacterium]